MLTHFNRLSSFVYMSHASLHFFNLFVVAQRIYNHRSVFCNVRVDRLKHLLACCKFFLVFIKAFSFSSHDVFADLVV